VTTGTNTAPVVIDGAIKSGTGIAALTGGNLLTINNYGASRVIVKHNGDIYSDSTAGVLLFDDHDDAALLRALSYELNPAAVIRNRFDDFVTYHRGDLEAAGIVEGTMVNQTALTRLLTGAMWQLHSRIAELEERLARG
jgi:sulfur carrier protein ThiS